MRHTPFFIALTLSLAACSQNQTEQKDSLARSAEDVALNKRMAVFEERQRRAASAESQRIMLAQTSISTMHVAPAPIESNLSNYAHLQENPVERVTERPVSTFSVDVDTSSYSNVRRILNEGTLPDRDAVRIEEMINYFSYDYPAPTSKDHPFSLTTELSQAPWNSDRWLLQIGLKGYELSSNAALPPANLVFLVDVSGSMHSANKLPLVKRALRMLASQMRDIDSIALVVYAGAAGTVLAPTSGSDKQAIYQAIDGLEAGGSTNGEAGIQLAYQLAEQHKQTSGINRIILCSDGDLNVGTTDVDQLKQLVARKRANGISLTTLSFGGDNYNDELMEQIADIGNGNAAFIDSLLEAKKVLIDQMGGTLLTIANDVKVQIEFNPATVLEYRLIGYENRQLAREDFNNDQVDAGDIGAGHTVTALYELTMLEAKQPAIDPLHYQPQTINEKVNQQELGWLKLRYKLPGAPQSELISQPIGVSSYLPPEQVSNNFKLASAVAAFAQRLQGGKYLGNFSYADIQHWLRTPPSQQDPIRSQFIELVELAELNAQAGA